MTTTIYFDYQIGQTVNFKYEDEYLKLPSDCFKTDFSKVNEGTTIEAEFVDGFTEAMLEQIIEEKFYEYSKNQLSSKETWPDIKRAWLIENQNSL